MPEPHLTERVKSAGFLKDGVSRRTFTKYRGAFDIDGNANAWSGFFCSLLGGSCVIKIASIKGFRQWYYSDLKSWLHYIPVRSDLSDLEEGVNWFAQHDVHAREIAARGRELALKIDMEHAVMRSAVSLSSWLERK
jgi:hypothetical protein